MITDPIGDLLTRIRNGAMAHKREIVMPYSKYKEAVANVLKREGYLEEVKKETKQLILSIAYKRTSASFKSWLPLISGVKNVSKPGVRIYRSVTDLPRPLGGNGIAIVSTPEGVLSDKEARNKRVGGEVLGEVW